MLDLVLTTSIGPITPRGYEVACICVGREKASLSYRVESVPCGARNAEHFAHRPSAKRHG